MPNAGINGWYEPVQQFCEQVGYSAGTLYAEFPAFDGALIHTETRDAGDVELQRGGREAYREATGQGIPSEVAAKWGVDRKSLEDFPADGVIPDDDPLYRYFQWFWREGDAWPLLNSATARGLKRGAGDRSDLWTFHDPAVRVASVFGSGGDVDVLSQWTYSYPEPIRIGLPTDELFAMARGRPRPQAVMKMTQLIWYRSQTAPIAQGDGANESARRGTTTIRTLPTSRSPPCICARRSGRRSAGRFKASCITVGRAWSRPMPRRATVTRIRKRSTNWVD